MRAVCVLSVCSVCVCCPCVLFKMPTCYWHSVQRYLLCAHTCARASGLLFLHQQKAGLHFFPALTTGQLPNTKYLFSAKTWFLYEFTLTFCLSPNQRSLISAFCIQKQVATHVCLFPELPCSTLAPQRPCQAFGTPGSARCYSYLPGRLPGCVTQGRLCKVSDLWRMNEVHGTCSLFLRIAAEYPQGA